MHETVYVESVDMANNAYEKVVFGFKLRKKWTPFKNPLSFSLEDMNNAQIWVVMSTES